MDITAIRKGCITVIDILAKIAIAAIGIVIFFTHLGKTGLFSLQGRVLIADVIPNLVWGIGIILAYWGWNKIIKRRNEKALQIRTLLCMQILLLLTQIFLAKQLFFYGGQDLGNVYMAAKITAAGGQDAFFTQGYFQMCPNNLALYAIFLVACKIEAVTGINAYGILVGSSIVCANLAVLLIQMCLQEMKIDGHIRLVTYVISIILIGLSPWIVVPYTDMLSMMIPVLTFYLYLRLCVYKKHQRTIYFLLLFIPLLFSRLKILNIIILLAMCIVEIVFGIRKRSKQAYVQGLVLTCIAILLVSSIVIGARKELHYQADKDKALSVEWFLLLGSNKESYGQWNKADYILAVETPQSKTDRIQTVEKTITNRIKEYGFMGSAEHIKNKIHIFFNDATFGFGISGGFVGHMSPAKDQIQDAFRQFFFPAENDNIACSMKGYGKYHLAYMILCQVTWIMVIMGMIKLIWERVTVKEEKGMVLEVTFIGIFLFCMLFEVSPRLLLSYLPIFILMAALGYRGQYEKYHVTTIWQNR